MLRADGDEGEMQTSGDWKVKPIMKTNLPKPKNLKSQITPQDYVGIAASFKLTLREDGGETSDNPFAYHYNIGVMTAALMLAMYFERNDTSFKKAEFLEAAGHTPPTMQPDAIES
jgi:hypothetical protein